jgi:general stress protein 26
MSGISQVSLVLHLKYMLFLSDFNEIWIFSSVSKNVQITNLIKTRPITAKLFHAEGGTDGQT